MVVVVIVSLPVASVVHEVVARPGGRMTAVEVVVVSVVAKIPGGGGLLEPAGGPRRRGDLVDAALSGHRHRDRRGPMGRALAAAFVGGGEQKGPDLLAPGEIVLLHHVGEVLVGLDGDEGVEVLRRQLAPDAHRAPPAQLPHLLPQLCPPSKPHPFSHLFSSRS